MERQNENRKATSNRRHDTAPKSSQRGFGARKLGFCGRMPGSRAARGVLVEGYEGVSLFFEAFAE
jgi:hypothetical protein